MIRQAFERAKIRNIPNASAFNDVPQGYWAEPPIPQAYEMGFMRDFPGNEFRPKQPMTKAQALVALMRGLNLDYNPPVATSQATTSPVPAKQRRIARNRLVFPLASTILMQPLLPVLSRQPQSTPAKSVPPTTVTTATAPSRSSTSEVVISYYKDADKIPKDAVDEVAAATKANIPVNYPDTRVLNATELLSRGSATTLIHQALVDRGQIEPLSNNEEATKYLPASAAKRNN